MSVIDLLESKREEQIALLNLEIVTVKCKQLEQKAEAIRLLCPREERRRI